MEIKHALSSLSKVLVVAQGDRKGKEMGRQIRLYAEATMGGGEGKGGGAGWYRPMPIQAPMNTQFEIGYTSALGPVAMPSQCPRVPPITPLASFAVRFSDTCDTYLAPTQIEMQVET